MKARISKCFHFFCGFGLWEYNWKYLLEMSSRKINANRNSDWISFSSLKGLLKSWRWRTVSLCAENVTSSSLSTKDSRFPRKECILGRVEVNWLESGQIFFFFYFTLKRGCISEAGLENFRLITMVVWLTFFVFCVLHLNYFPKSNSEGLHFHRFCWTTPVYRNANCIAFDEITTFVYQL